MIEVVKQVDDKIVILSMKSEVLEVEVTNYGCTILKILAPNKEGIKEDVVLGYDTIQEYQTNDGYLGAVVGRVANRIKGGTFDLNNETYQLDINNGPNALHGGIKGFSYQTFDYQIIDDQTISFNYVSPDGDQGYPGELDFTVTYQLVDHTLYVTYNATTSKDTILNITNHSYFNLTGNKENIYNHVLQIHGEKVACVDEFGCTTGELFDVTGTPFDFTTPKEVGKQIVLEHEQLTLGTGFDHPFLFTQEKDQVILQDLTSGRQLTVSTTLPQAQIYTANFLTKRNGKYGQTYNERDAICIETQNMPDAIHLEEKPTTILKKGEVFEETTSYTFEVIK